ncbi:NAD-dependent epimerase/dehydratase family protein [Phragmitibacter flavus]|uniref:NAD-dependent epimerase/dehydratase family protein n=1 Tax=Phragmitibacter flavus TaxID=2576071 RepID=A0A5R8KKB1_9BACT|nr:SDR family oxidoreductase [Phragmitibacter flavus]TLD72732.1 NAD-dependent epimerase/dehydratase family protein [Phragmitibacter flavus]
MNILLTGYTGNLGKEMAHQLAGHEVHALVRDVEKVNALHQPHVQIHPGDFDELPNKLAADIEVIIHAAASTAFRAPLATLREVNVEGTARMLEFARRCPLLKKFVQVSTACVCGTNVGLVEEARLVRPIGFVNAYEQSKWEAEELVFDSDLPVEVVRLSIVAGSETDGSVLRLGAMHHLLFWLWKGLIPMMPGSDQTRVDLISTEYAAAVVAACVDSPLESGRVMHGCAGDAAPRLSELLQHLASVFEPTSNGWRSGSIVAPAIVDAETFAMFKTSVMQSGDVLFRRVLEDAESFLPGLLHPRQHATDNADRCCLQPRADWKPLTELVTHHVIQSKSRS